MMAKKPSRERKLDTFNLRMTLFFIVLGGLMGWAMERGFTLKSDVFKGLGLVLLVTYCVVGLVFMVRWHQLLDEGLQQRNYQASTITLFLCLMVGLCYSLFYSFFYPQIPQPSVTDGIMIMLLVYVLSWFGLWWRSR
jgi:hypothetical protein